MASKVLLSSYRLGSLNLKNRVVMAPLTRGRCGDDHVPGAANALYYAQRASAGLLITEATAISQQGTGWDGAPGIYSPEQVAGFKQVTDAVHAAGGLIFCQLWHMGRVTHSDFFGIQPVSASAIAVEGQTHVRNNRKVDYEVPRALELSEIPALINDYKHAASCAKEAGFDGVEVHGANGYLLDQFLQSVSNQRTDAYGGSAENRARLLLEVLEAVAGVWEKERIGVRIGPNGLYNGMGSEDNIETFEYVAQRLTEFGLGYLHVMDGLGFGYHNKCPPLTIQRVRELFPGTLIGNVGYSQESAESTIAAGHADLIAFGRPYLSNPDLVERFAQDAPLADVPPYSAWYRQYPSDDRNAGYTDFPAMA